jgi:hypothetical protein
MNDKKQKLKAKIAELKTKQTAIKILNKWDLSL